MLALRTFLIPSISKDPSGKESPTIPPNKDGKHMGVHRFARGLYNIHGKLIHKQGRKSITDEVKSGTSSTTSLTSSRSPSHRSQLIIWHTMISSPSQNNLKLRTKTLMQNIPNQDTPVRYQVTLMQGARGRATPVNNRDQTRVNHHRIV